MDNPNAHLTQGQGPFRPPSAQELSAANQRVRELEAQVARLQSVVNVNTGGDLISLLNTAITVEGASVDIEGDDEAIIVTIDGATINEDDEIVGPSQDFEVEFHVEFEGVLTVRARSEFEADDAVSDALENFRWELDSLDVDEDDTIVDQRVGSVELTHRFRG